MTWQYAIRGRRLVELFDCPEDPDLDGAYAVLGWRDAPRVLRDMRWVIKGVRADRNRV